MEPPVILLEFILLDNKYSEILPFENLILPETKKKLGERECVSESKIKSTQNIPIHWFTPKITRSHVRPKLRAGNSSQGSHVIYRNPITWAIPASFQCLHWQNGRLRRNRQVKNKSTLMPSPTNLFDIISSPWASRRARIGQYRECSLTPKTHTVIWGTT